MSAATRPAHLARVFEQLRSGAATARELVAETGLSRPTVMALLAALEEDGLIRSQDQESNAPGRPASTWSIATDAGFVIGIDLLVETALVAVARVDGTIVATELVGDIPLESGDRLAALSAIIERNLATNSATLGPLRALSISTTGTVDAEGTVMDSTSIPSWTGFPLGGKLGDHFGLPVRVENDINAAAYGEFVLRCSEGQLEDNDDLLLVALSRSVLTGLVMGGQIHRGRGFNAGEIGVIVAEERGPEEGHLSRAADIIGSAAAVLDPSVIVISVPMTQLPDAIGEINAHLRQSRAASSTPLTFEGARLRQGGAVVGSVSLALKDAQERLLDRSTKTTIAPTALNLVQEAITKGKHLPVTQTTISAPTLRIGVVGVGARSSLAKHFERPELGGVITAACEPHPDAAKRVLSRLGRDDITLTTSVADLVATGVDAVLVTSPDDTHADVACELLEAGVPVYLEKPLAIHLDDATRILEAGFRTGTKLYVGHNMRHMDVVRGMRRIIRDGLIGEVKAIWCRHFVGHGGDFYFKDWHATQEHGNGLLLQKAAHDLDVMHWLADSHTVRVTAMGGLTVYGDVEDRRDRSNELMGDWFNPGANWPPLAQTGLNPVIDVEDLSMMLMRMESGVYASYEQCHYTPDYWRNYTVIGTAGRIENFGDGDGGVIKLWNKRGNYDPQGDAQFPIVGDGAGHDDADVLTISEFVRFVRDDAPTDTSPLGAWYSVAAAIQATESLRADSAPRDIPGLPADLVEYYTNNQTKQ